MDKNLFKHIMEAENNGYSSSHYDIYNDLYVSNTESATLAKQASETFKKKLLCTGIAAGAVGGGMKYSYDKGFNRANEIAANFRPGNRTSDVPVYFRGGHTGGVKDDSLAFGRKLYENIPEGLPENLNNILSVTI